MPGWTRRLTVAACGTAYVLVLAVANLFTSTLGMVPARFGLTVTAGTYTAGLALAVRDTLHDLAGAASSCSRWPWPPPSRPSARTIHLPIFLIDLLTEHRSTQKHRSCSPAPTEHSCADRTSDGEPGYQPRKETTAKGWPPLFPGLHFHDLRHTHKTWLIEDGVLEVAQSKRLGHRLGGIRGFYSHVTQPMINTLLAGLQRRWEQTGSTTTGDHYQSTSVVKINCAPMCSHGTRTARQ